MRHHQNFAHARRREWQVFTSEAARIAAMSVRSAACDLHEGLIAHVAQWGFASRRALARHAMSEHDCGPCFERWGFGAANVIASARGEMKGDARYRCRLLEHP